MQIKKPLSPRMVVWIASGVFATIAPPAFSQEYRPAVDDRVGGEEIYPLVPDEDVKPTSGWEIGALLSVAYDDNIFLSSTDAESDMVLNVAPQIAYRRGDPDEGEGFDASIGYRPTAVAYADHGSENRLDHEAVALIGWRGKVTRIAYSGAFRKLGDATAETGRPTDRLAFANEVRAGWTAREKITLEGAVGSRQSDYLDPFYFDSRKDYAELAVRYGYSPKTEVGLAYQVGRFHVDGSGKQDTHQLTANIVWQPRSKVRIDLEAGAEHRRTDLGTETNPVLEGRIDWTPRQGTDLFVNGYMREEASAFYAGQNYSLHGASAGIKQRLGGGWSARLDGGFEKYSYQRVSGNGASGRNDSLWFIRPALVYDLTTESDLSLFYRFSENDSNDPAFGYDRTMLGVELNHQF